MRQIKFRAWDNVRGSMNYPLADASLVSRSYDEVTLLVAQGVDSNSSNEDFEIMQFTGLHDSKGVEIYEGDIVITSLGGAAVEYDSKTASFKAFTPYRFKMAINHTREKASLSVIGNIYQNPDLLK